MYMQTSAYHQERFPCALPCAAARTMPHCSPFLTLPTSSGGCTLSDIQSPISSSETEKSLHTSASLWRETLSYLKGKQHRRKSVKKWPSLSQDKTGDCLYDPTPVEELVHL